MVGVDRRAASSLSLIQRCCCLQQCRTRRSGAQRRSSLNRTPRDLHACPPRVKLELLSALTRLAQGALPAPSSARSSRARPNVWTDVLARQLPIAVLTLSRRGHTRRRPCRRRTRARSPELSRRLRTRSTRCPRSASSASSGRRHLRNGTTRRQRSRRPTRTPRPISSARPRTTLRRRPARRTATTRPSLRRRSPRSRRLVRSVGTRRAAALRTPLSAQPRDIIRIDRTYDAGETCQFWSGFPSELAGRVRRSDGTRAHDAGLAHTPRQRDQ